MSSQSQGESIGAGNPPNVIIVGNINKLPQNMKNNLPTGYSTQTKDSPRPVSFHSGDENDPVAVYKYKPGNPRYDIQAQIDHAISNGKEDIYIIIDDEKPKEGGVGTTIEDLEPHVEGKVDPFNILFDFLSPASYADSVRGSNCGGSTYPAGTCSSATFFDDDSSDGRTPGFELCVDYNAFACYFDSILDHLKKNLADSNSSVCESHSSNSDCSYVECMNQHNNPTFMKAPVGLEIEIYFDGGDLINDIVGDCGGTISTICGCAFGGGDVNDDPLRSVDAEFKMNGQHSCSWVELIRHEVAHTYGYRHVPGQQDYDNNRDDLKHCVKNRHRVH